MKASNKFLTGILSLAMIAAVILVPPMLAEEWKEEGEGNLIPTLEILSGSEILQTEHENFTENSTVEYYPYAEFNETTAGTYEQSGTDYIGAHYMDFNPYYERHQMDIIFNYLNYQDYLSGVPDRYIYEAFVYFSIDWYQALQDGAVNLYFNITTEPDLYLNLRALHFVGTNTGFQLAESDEITSFPGRMTSYLHNHEYYITLTETDINQALAVLDGYAPDHQLLWVYLRIGYSGGGYCLVTEFTIDIQAHPDFYEEETIFRTYHNYTTNETVYNNLTVLTPHLGSRTSYNNIARVSLGIGGGFVLLVALVASPFVGSFNILLPATSNRSRNTRRRRI